MSRVFFLLRGRHWPAPAYTPQRMHHLCADGPVCQNSKPLQKISPHSLCWSSQASRSSTSWPRNSPSRFAWAGSPDRSLHSWGSSRKSKSWVWRVPATLYSIPLWALAQRRWWLFGWDGASSASRLTKNSFAYLRNDLTRRSLVCSSEGQWTFSMNCGRESKPSCKHGGHSSSARSSAVAFGA